MGHVLGAGGTEIKEEGQCLVCMTPTFQSGSQPPGALWSTPVRDVLVVTAGDAAGVSWVEAWDV